MIPVERYGGRTAAIARLTRELASYERPLADLEARFDAAAQAAEAAHRRGEPAAETVAQMNALHNAIQTVEAEVLKVLVRLREQLERDDGDA